LNQDLTINTAELRVETAAEIVIAAVQQKLTIQLKASDSK